MDLLVYPARLLARPATAWLDVPGATPEQRREQLIVEMTEYGTKDDLVDRQLTRSAVWFLLLAFALVPMVALTVALVLVLGGDGGVASLIPWGVLLFLFWMAVITGLKFGAAALLPEERWHPASPFARALLLAQTPDVILALIITAVSLVLVR
jgi:hypothetical protein